MNSNNNKNKLHYKMYKSGKKWIIAGIFTITAGTSIILNNNTASADSVHSTQNNISSNNSSDTNFSSNSGVSSASTVTSSSSIDNKEINSLNANDSQFSGNDLSNFSSSVAASNSYNNQNISGYNKSAFSNNSSIATSDQSKTTSSSSSNTTSDKSSATSSSNSSSTTSDQSNTLSSNNDNTINSNTTKLNDNSASVSTSAKSTSSDTSTPEGLMTNTVLNQNFHYNVPRGYSNDIQTILPHKDSTGKIDYYDIYYLYNPDPNQHVFNDEWYHARTSDFKTFTPFDESNPTGVNNVAIPDPNYTDSNGNPTQIADNNKNGIPWNYAATGSVLYNNGLLKTDQWGNQIDSNAKIAYFTSILPTQSIYLAYSNNDQQFHPYSNTPVMTPEIVGASSTNFRDPQVVRTDSGKLISYVAGGYSRTVYTLTSDDGVNWSHNSSDDINMGDLSDSHNTMEVETPIVRTINNQAFMFFSWHDGDTRANVAVNGVIDNNDIFRLTPDSKQLSVDGSIYKGDTYASSYTNLNDDTLVNINWNGNWTYSPLDPSGGYNYLTMHSGSFTLPRLIVDSNGNLKYAPIEPNNQLVNTYKTSSDGSGSTMIANTNNKLDFSFDNSNIVKTITLSRAQSNISITIGNGSINLKRENSLNPNFSKNDTIPLNVNNISKLSMYVDNASIELYIPESNQSYNIVNFGTKQNEPYKMTINTGATIDNYEFNSNYPSLTSNQFANVITNLNSNISNDEKISNSLSAIVNSYATNTPQDSDYVSLSTKLSDASTSLSSAVKSISTANSYVSAANSMNGDARFNLYLTLASSAYADASNAENYSMQSIMSTRNTLATKAPSSTGELNGKQVINGHNVLFIDGKQVSGEVYTDSDGQSHYYDSINGYEGINLFYLNDGKYYYFDSNGNMVKNQFISAVPNTNYTYYFGSDGAAVNGNQNINGKNYLFSDGIQVKDTMIINSNDTFSYYDDNGLIATAPVMINNQEFNFDSDGKLIAPNQFIKNPSFPSATYYLDSNNQFSKGFQDINGGKYYFDSNGHMIINTYEVDNNGNYYRFGPDGRALTGKQIVDFTKRYFSSDGVQIKYTAYIDNDNRLSFYDGDGNPIDKVNGENGKNVSTDSNDNIVAPNTFIISPLNSSLIYHLNNENQVTKGFTEIDGFKYYFNNDGVMLINGTINDDKGNVYSANSNGILVLQSKETTNSSSATSSSSANNSTTTSSSSANSSSVSSSTSINTPTSPSSNSNASTSTNAGTSSFTGLTTTGNNGYVSAYFPTTSSSTTTSSSSSSSSVTFSISSSLVNGSSSSAISSSQSSSSSQVVKSSSSDNSSLAISNAKSEMIKAHSAVKVASKIKKQSDSKSHVNSYNEALNNYYKAEKKYLKISKLYNNRYYYDFDKVTKNSKYVKINRLAYVHDSKKFTNKNKVSKLKKDSKVKVNKIIRYGKTTRFNIGHNKFITGLKSFIHKLNK